MAVRITVADSADATVLADCAAESFSLLGATGV